ncbi:hypothetical protein SUDANB6_00403 [Streptomyces sp. enrichment culture]
MSRLLRVFAVGVLVVSAAGHAATEYINGTLPTPAPPGPYGSRPPPPPCTEPQQRPADCPPPGGGCPPQATPAGPGGPAFEAEPSGLPAVTAYTSAELARPPGTAHRHVCATAFRVATRK